MPPMFRRVAPSRTVSITGCALLLVVAAFATIDVSKFQTLRPVAPKASDPVESFDQSRTNIQADLLVRDSTIAAQQAQLAECDHEITASEQQFVRISNENRELNTAIEAKDCEIASLNTKIAEQQPDSVDPGAASTVEMQAQLDETRQQLDSAERENRLLATKIQAVQERAFQLEEERKRRVAHRNTVGVRGTILAVNQAYNFVVLNLGGRNGIEPQSEMLILRDGTFIGKIRISSVEPVTSIGDIMPNTLARGVQVQTGDVVIYAGSNS